MIETTRRPTHPGAILKELYLEPMHVGISEFADCIGISRKTVSAIINGHRRVTPDMAVRFSMALSNTDAEMWLNLQKACIFLMRAGRWSIFQSHRSRYAALRLPALRRSGEKVAGSRIVRALLPCFGL